ncbi:MAG TPA: CYTH domain-containing protein [Gemmatimonadales bacterium]|nr:CYTH domain-containing protein [Gemmatimonadales bacterium]
MKDELELKARVDDPAALEAALQRAGAELVFRGEMQDGRYDRDGTLDARDEVLRLRTYRGTASYGVLAWKGPASVQHGYKRREEHETRLEDAAAAAAALIVERLGYEVVMRIDRTIVEYRIAQAAVRIEWYPSMDVLVEVEGEPVAIERAIAATGISRDRFLPEPLSFFTADYERRTGRAARIAAS